MRWLAHVAAVIFLALWLFTASQAAEQQQQPRQGSAERLEKVQPKTPQFDAAAINDPGLRDVVGPDSAGSAVVRAQILLDRAHFSPGEIDGHYGVNLRIAITGYQQARGIPPTGVVDPDTWKSLNQDPGPALIPYITAPQDVMGPFQPIPRGMMEQAELDFLGYRSPAEELGERFHLAPSLLVALNRGVNLRLPGRTLLVPNVTRAYGVVKAAKVIVSKSRKTVTVLSGNGQILAQYPATIGSTHDPLPIGDWIITDVWRNPKFYYNPALFWDANPEDSRAVLQPGPNSPVGIVWINLSKEHYGIHGTPEPGKVGHTQSHGCVRLTNWDAAELSEMVDKGTPAILTE